MVEISNYGSHIELRNVKVVISEEGRIYLDFPEATRGDQYFLINTDKISKKKLEEIYKSFKEWNKEIEGEEENSCDY